VLHARGLPDRDLVDLCAAETRGAGCEGRMGATRLDLRDHGTEDRSVIDLEARFQKRGVSVDLQWPQTGIVLARCA
jgi:hypothetical protein